MECKSMTCIVCPFGCNIEVSSDNSSPSGYKVNGNRCKRGENYGIKEVTNPTRVLTSTVKLRDSALRRLPVRTDSDIPKHLLFECMKELNKVVVQHPVKSGDIIVANILGTGVNVISSKSI